MNHRVDICNIFIVLLSLCFSHVLADGIAITTAAMTSIEDEFSFAETEFPLTPPRTIVDDPFTGSLKMISARQIGGIDRWVNVGAVLEMKYEKFSSVGQLYAQGRLDLNFAYDIENDAKSVKDDKAVEFRLRELYWSRSFASSTIAMGNLITAWSIGDLITLSDRLSVTDRSRAMFANPEDVISGQNSIKLDVFAKQLRISTVFVPYPLFDIFDDGEHPYSITPGLKIKNPSDYRKPEAAVRIAIDSERSAFSFLLGWVNNREPILDTQFLTDAKAMHFTQLHKPYLYLGLLATIAKEPLLYKFELTFDHARPRQAISTHKLANGIIKADGASVLLGFDYNAGDYGTYIFEGVSEWIKDDSHEKRRLSEKKHRWRMALGWSKALQNDRLKIDAAAIILDTTKNTMLRFQVGYDVTSQFNLSLKLNGMFFNEPSKKYAQIEDWDRLEVCWEFVF